MSTTPIRRNESFTAIVQADSNEERSLLWREWLDTFYLVDDAKRAAMLDEEPPFSGTVWDALLAAGAEWLAHRMGRKAPSWAMKPCRRAPRAYFGRSQHYTKANGFDHDRAPAEFFSRHLYIGPEFMLRARTPKDWIPEEPYWIQRATREFFAKRQKKKSESQ